MDAKLTEDKTKETANSREGLDDYVRISSPGIVITIFALVLVTAAVIVWGLIGKLPVTETVTGVVLDQYKEYDYKARCITFNVAHFYLILL